MEEHLREIRTLRRRLEDSIQTNDRLRQQLEERLASSARNGGQRLTQSRSSSQKVQQCCFGYNIFDYIFYKFQMYLPTFHQQEEHPLTSISKALILSVSCPMRFDC